MIVKFNEINKAEKVGNKAKSLIEMKNAGFNVPDGFVLDSDTYLEEIKHNGIDKKINDLLSKKNKDNKRKTNKKIVKMYKNKK